MEFSSLVVALLTLFLGLCCLCRGSYLGGDALMVLRKQGIKGPVGNPLYGGVMVDVLKLRHTARQRQMEASTSHDIVAKLHPDYSLFSRQYGTPYLFWWLDGPRLAISSPDMVRELLSTKANFTGRSPAQLKGVIPLLGRGLIAVDGDEWVQHRRVVPSAFRLDKLKNMLPTFGSCTEEMLDMWEDKVGNSDCVEIEAEAEFERLAANVISRAAFGSGYEKGRRVVDIQKPAVRLAAQMALYDWIPFIRLFPTRLNREMRSVDQEVNSVLLELIKDKKQSMESGKTSSYGDDLLGNMIAESQGEKSFDDWMLVGECRTFYLAGHETVASVLTWTTFLLSVHPEWQDRAGAEVREVCQSQSPTVDTLNKLKVFTMVLLESLRLYPPAITIGRSCLQDMQVGELLIPKSTSIEIAVLAIHHDEELWGPDAHQFKPKRFANGASKAAKHPNAFMPFSYGPRVCVGQSFAFMETKLVLASVLLPFSLSLSPSYRHSPTIRGTLKPWDADNSAEVEHNRSQSRKTKDGRYAT